MKITLYVPKGTQSVRKFLKDELAQAMNIKSKDSRNTIESGLRKIINRCPDIFDDGMCFKTDGDELLITVYDGLR